MYLGKRAISYGKGWEWAWFELLYADAEGNRLIRWLS
jgi:hypothetical protein